MDPSQPQRTQPLPGQQIYWSQSCGRYRVMASRGWHAAKIVLGTISLMICPAIVGIASAGQKLLSKFPLMGLGPEIILPLVRIF